MLVYDTAVSTLARLHIVSIPQIHWVGREDYEDKFRGKEEWFVLSVLVHGKRELETRRGSNVNVTR